MAELSLLGKQLPASLILGAIAASAYLISHARHRGLDFRLFDFLVVAAIMAIGTAVTMPLVSGAQDQASSVALLQNLRMLRGQIERYKVEHGGEAPLLYEGAFPQLTHATNSRGVPGPSGTDYPYGPYLPAGVPVNPYTGVSVVTPCETFPPSCPSEVGGWLYHQETGRIAADLDEYLSE